MRARAAAAGFEKGIDGDLESILLLRIFYIPLFFCLLTSLFYSRDITYLVGSTILFERVLIRNAHLVNLDHEIA